MRLVVVSVALLLFGTLLTSAQFTPVIVSDADTLAQFYAAYFAGNYTGLQVDLQVTAPTVADVHNLGWKLGVAPGTLVQRCSLNAVYELPNNATAWSLDTTLQQAAVQPGGTEDGPPPAVAEYGTTAAGAEDEQRREVE